MPYPTDLPPGIDPRAVAADPQGYQNWLKQTQAQEAARPGSTQFAPQAAQQPMVRPSGAFGQLGNTSTQSDQWAYNQPTPQAGGQPNFSPQALSQGLQQQQARQNMTQASVGMPQGQIPMTLQRQPQGGMAGRNMPAAPMARRPRF